jgi:hypothetical protein
MALCILVDGYQRFGGTYWLRLQGITLSYSKRPRPKEQIFGRKIEVLRTLINEAHPNLYTYIYYKNGQIKEG